MTTLASLLDGRRAMLDPPRQKEAQTAVRAEWLVHGRAEWLAHGAPQRMQVQMLGAACKPTAAAAALSASRNYKQSSNF